MEPVIQKYLTALETKDFEALAELFTKNGHYCDYCANGTSQHEFHLYGKEAISMFFRNKFLFCQYSILSPTILNGSQAEFIASYGGYQVMAIASLQQLTADGHPPTDRATEIIQSHNILYNERICTHDKRNRKQTEHPPL